MTRPSVAAGQRNRFSRHLSRRGAAMVAGSIVLAALASCSSGKPAPGVTSIGNATSTSAPGGASSAAAGPLDLPRIPWAGGPAYYAKFKAAAAWGWTSPHFFPISAWDASVNTPAEVAQDKAAGINTYLNLDTANYAAIRAAHMSAIVTPVPGQDPGTWGPEVVGYDLTDEPDGWARAGHGPINQNKQECSTNKACGYTLLEYLDRISPQNTGLFRYTNFTSTVINQPGIGTHFLNDYQDVVSIDDYFYTSTGDACYIAKFYELVQAGQCPKAANYGMDVAKVQAIAPRKQVWNYVELGTTSDGGGNITPGRISGAVWSSIINGAMGINYFIEDTANGPCGMTGNVIRDTSCPEAVAATREVTRVDKQIRNLAPVLNTQSFRFTFNPELDTMLKYRKGSYYIFAMPGLDGGAGTHTLRLPPGLHASRVQVVGEGRTIPITNNAFSDSFAQEYSYHIYRITP